MLYNLYTFETLEPIQAFTGKCSAKIGIAKDDDSRNGDYQQAIGPDFPFQFNAVWEGPESDIRWLEKQVLKHFKVNRCAEIRALSEWIKDTTAIQIIEYVDSVIISKNLNIKRVDK
jgi:hypothetical protein